MSIFSNIKRRITSKHDRDLATSLLDSLMSLPEIRESYGSTTDAHLSLDDVGWTNLTSQPGFAYGETDFQMRRRTIDRARAYWRKDPLAHQAIRIWTDYAIGYGLSFRCEDTSCEKTLREFWGRKENRRQFGAEGQRLASSRLLVDGDIFYVLVGEPPDVVIRTFDPLEITSIISDPEDADRILFYKREWVPMDLSGRPQAVKILYYRDYSLDPSEAATLAQSLDGPIEENAAIYHVAFDRYGRWGNSLLTSAIDWNREHRKFMEARVSIIQSLARFAFKAKTGSGAAAIANIKKSMAPGTSQQPLGATWIENSGIELSAMPRDTGAGSAKTDGDMLKLQVCAATGIMQHYMGDPSTGNLASATAMELPMLKMFTSYQRLWTDAYTDIFCYVAQVDRPGDIGLDIDWPPIVDIDDNLRAQAISSVISSFPAFAELDSVKMIALETLRINDLENQLKELEDIQAERDAKQQEMMQSQAAATKKNQVQGKQPPNQMPDAMPMESFADALRKFREAITPNEYEDEDYDDPDDVADAEETPKENEP